MDVKYDSAIISSEDIAVLCDFSDIKWTIKELIWPLLDHPNFLPLHYMFDLNE